MTFQFIWKLEAEPTADEQDMPSSSPPPNLTRLDWAPQREILLQPRTLAFVTHCGMNSVTEATYSGVPLLCVPLFGDQGRNSRMVERKGVGRVLDKRDLGNKDRLLAALRHITEDGR